MTDDTVRIALVISNLGHGGAERQIVEIANNMPPPFEIHIVSLSYHMPLASDLRIPADRLHVVERRHRFDVSVPIRLRALLRSLDVALVHAFLFDAEIAARLARAAGAAWPLIGSERNSRHEYSLLQSFLLRRTQRFVARCVANSAAGARYHAELTSREADHYRVVYNGVNTDRFRPDAQAAETRAALGIGADNFVAGLFGSFKPQKNYEQLIRIVQPVIERCPQVRFVVIGDEIAASAESARYHVTIRRAAKARGIDQHIIWAGARTDVEKLYPVCDVTLLLSLHEGTPNVVLESLSSGVPAIVSDVSDNRLLVRDGETGFVVAVNDDDAVVDRLASLYEDRGRLGELAGCARRDCVERFSLATMCSCLGDVYREQLDAS